MTNLKWQSAYSTLRLGSSLLIIPVILAATESHEIILYGYVSFITALTLGLDLGIQSIGIARFSKLSTNDSSEFCQAILTLKRLYLFLFWIAIAALVLFSFWGDDIGHYSTEEIALLIIHSISSVVNLRLMWQDALLIGTNRLASLRKIQSLSLVLLISFFYLLNLYYSSITSFILANFISIILLRLIIVIFLNKTNLKSLIQITITPNYHIFLEDIKYILPASVTALVTSRVVYFLGLTSFEEHESALFVTLFSILNMTNFAAMVYKDSNAYELTKQVTLTFPVLKKSFLWQLTTFLTSFLVLFLLKEYIIILRPEIIHLKFITALIFYVYIFLESIAGLFSLVLLNNRDYRYVNWFVILMTLSVIILSVFSVKEFLTITNLVTIVAIGWVIYALFLLKMLYDYKQA